MSNLVIKYKRTNNNIANLLDNMEEGEMGIVLDDGYLIVKGKDGEFSKIKAKPIRYWFSGVTNDGNDYKAFLEGSNDATFYQSGKLIKQDVYSVNSAEHMFASNSNLISLDLSNFDTSDITSTRNMFASNSNLISLDLSNFDTSNVTDMTYMFDGCSSLTSLDLSNFNTSNVTNMYGMFNGCTSLKSLDLSNLIIITNIKTLLAYPLSKSLKRLIANNMNISGETTLHGAFNDSNIEVVEAKNWNVSSVAKTTYMFSGCTNLTSVDLSNWNTINLSSAIGMFSSCTNLAEANLGNWNTTKLENISGMFRGCKSLTSVTLSNWNTSSITNMNNLFRECSSLTSLTISNFDTSNVTSMTSMFNGCTSLELLDISNLTIITNINALLADPLSNSLKRLIANNMNISGETSFDSIFKGSNIEVVEAKNWNASSVTIATKMFSGCTNLTSVDLSDWNTINLENITEMFRGCKSLTSVTLSNFDTSNVTSMNNLFRECSSLTSLDLSSWDTSNVTSMNYLFHTCSNLRYLNLSNFNTEKVKFVENSGNINIFNNCSSSLEITCKSSFRKWCIDNASKLKLPTPLRDQNSSQWHIVD